MIDEVFNHRVGAFIRQFLVVGVGTHAVGMAGYGQLSSRGFGFQASGNLVEYQFVGRGKRGFIKLEVDIANDDGFFLDHNRFFDHRRRWWATVGIDLNAFRRAWALVATIRHTVAVFVAITVHPAISRCRTADEQSTIPCPCRAFGRSEARTHDTTNSRTGRPVGFLQTCATSQDTG
ncbi:hypothetical protein D9M69_436670 [compost metagenome]